RKYTVRPSLENAGELTLQPSGVRRTGGAASRAKRSSIQSEVAALLACVSMTRLANTSFRPSGDSPGEEQRSIETRSSGWNPRSASATAGRTASNATDGARRDALV